MAVMDDEREGGDPPCWAHLFEDMASAAGDGPDDAIAAPGASGSGGGDVGAVDLVALARAWTAEGAAWTRQSDDLNVNLLVFGAGGGVGEHVNAEVDVLVVGVAGEWVVEVDGRPWALRAGQALIVPKGSCRAIRAISDGFAYLSGHRRRAGLWPSAGVHRAP